MDSKAHEDIIELNFSKKISLEGLERAFILNKAITPPFYNVNLIELARKEQNKSDIISNMGENRAFTKENEVAMRDYNRINQRNLLDNDNEEEVENPLYKVMDIDGRKSVNQYIILKLLGRFFK